VDTILLFNIVRLPSPRGVQDTERPLLPPDPLGIAWVALCVAHLEVALFNMDSNMDTARTPYEVPVVNLLMAIWYSIMLLMSTGSVKA